MTNSTAVSRRQQPEPGHALISNRMRAAANIGALLSGGIGLIALAGWSTNSLILAKFYTSGSAMQPITALSSVLAAAAVLLVARSDEHSGAARLLAVVVLGIAAQTLIEHWTGSDFGTDRLLFPDTITRQPHYEFPGRMAEPTATAFLFMAAALILARVRGRAAGAILSGLATIVLLLVTVALLSHMYAIAPLTGVLGFTQVSVPTAMALGGLSVGALALRPGGGWVSLLTGRSVGATAARWLLPVVISVPIIVASLALRGSQEGLYPADFRMAFTTAVTIILLAALALWGTKQLDRLVAERRSAEALRESEATLRAFFETEGLLASIVERRGTEIRYLASNRALARLFDRKDLAGLNVWDVGAKDVTEPLLDGLAQVEESGSALSMEQSISTPGRPRWFMMTISPIADSPSNAPRFALASYEITDRKRAEERQQLLLAELSHRVKNTIAIVQSLAQQSFRGDQATPEARIAFESRLTAVASAHSLLVKQEWTSASLSVLVADVAGPGCGADRSRFDVDGPDVLLPPQTAVSLALAFHELCTNAVKYGALSNETGRISISWAVERKQHCTVRIKWIETDGPPVSVPKQRGFGSRLIERALSTELEAPAELRFDPGGLTCVMAVIIPPDAT